MYCWCSELSGNLCSADQSPLCSPACRSPVVCSVNFCLFCAALGEFFYHPLRWPLPNWSAPHLVSPMGTSAGLDSSQIFRKYLGTVPQWTDSSTPGETEGPKPQEEPTREPEKGEWFVSSCPSEGPFPPSPLSSQPFGALTLVREIWRSLARATPWCGLQVRRWAGWTAVPVRAKDPFPFLPHPPTPPIRLWGLPSHCASFGTPSLPFSFVRMDPAAILIGRQTAFLCIREVHPLRSYFQSGLATQGPAFPAAEEAAAGITIAICGSPLLGRMPQ